MPFVKIEVTQEESRDLLLQDEELDRLFQSAGGGPITRAIPNLPRNWYINEEEDASFCMLCSGDIPGYNPKHLYTLKIHKNYIVFELVGNKVVRFIHNSFLLDNDLYRVKYLILAGLNSVGYWGVGVTDIFADAVFDPAFEFAQELRS